MQSIYQTPRVREVAFEFESVLLTQSQFGSGAGGFDQGDGEIEF